MFTMPIVAFYVAQHQFRHKADPDSWAAGVAILVVNLVIAGFCIHAFSEKDDDDDDQTREDEKKNKKSQPRVGAFKERID
jgi:VMA21-like domain